MQNGIFVLSEDDLEKRRTIMIDRLEALRTEKAITQLDLCKKIGIAEKTYRQWKGGVMKNGVLTYPFPSLDNLYRLSAFFGVSIDYLTGNSNYRNIDTGMISDITGLSEESIGALKECKDNTNLSISAKQGYHIRMLIDTLLSSICSFEELIYEDEFDIIVELLDDIYKYLFLNVDNVYGSETIPLSRKSYLIGVVEVKDILPAFLVRINNNLTRLKEYI